MAYAPNRSFEPLRDAIHAIIWFAGNPPADREQLTELNDAHSLLLSSDWRPIELAAVGELATPPGYWLHSLIDDLHEVRRDRRLSAGPSWWSAIERLQKRLEYLRALTMRGVSRLDDDTNAEQSADKLKNPRPSLPEDLDAMALLNFLRDRFKGKSPSEAKPKAVAAANADFFKSQPSINKTRRATLTKYSRNCNWYWKPEASAD